MKHASTNKLICIQLQLVSQINKAKDLFKKQQEWYGHEEKKINVLLASTKRLLEAINLGNFLNFEEGRTLALLWLCCFQKNFTF